MRTLVVIAAATVVVAVPLAHAATWRMAIVASDKDFSDHGSLILDFGTTLDTVSAWRLVARVDGGTLLTRARIRCGEGLSLRARTVNLGLRAGRGTYPLPVPNPEGPCIVQVSASLGDPGEATVKLQYLP